MPFVAKFAVKLCKLPDFGPSTETDSQMKLSVKIMRHLININGMVYLADAMQMNNRFAQTIYQNNTTEYSKLVFFTRLQ